MTDHIKIGDIQPWAQVEQTVAGTTEFEFPFPIFEDADLEVYVDAALKTLAADYTVAGAGADDGGAVTFAAAPPMGALVTLRRRLAIARTSDFQETGEFRAKVLNDELDYQTAALQQVANDLDRSVRLAATAPSIDLDFTPAADRVLAVNAAGDGMTMGPTVTHIAEAGTNAAAAAASAAAAGASAAAALAARIAAELAADTVEGVLTANRNLADLDDVAIARDNLGVYSRAETDAALAALPYDIPFNAGFGSEFTGEDLVAGQVCGDLILGRDIVIEGEVGFIGTPAAGAAVIVDALYVRPGVTGAPTSIYSTPPLFAAGSGTLTAGVLAVSQLNAGDVVMVKPTQVGTTTRGQKLRFTLKAKTR